MTNLDRLPVCDCGCKAWKPGGFQMGGATFTQNQCGACGRIAMGAYRHGLDLVFISADDAEKDPVNGQMQRTVEYINGTMAIVARAYESQWKAVQDVISTASVNKVIRDFGMDPDDGITVRWVEGAKHDDTHKYDAVNAKGEVMPVDGDVYIETIRNTVPDPLRPNQLVPPPLPPRIPEGITCWMWVQPKKKEFDKEEPEAGFQKVDPAEIGRAHV